MLLIAYVSRAVAAMAPAELQDLVTRAAAANGRNGLTGALLYHDGQFMQFLEGPEAVVRSLFDRIRRDPRHTDVYLVAEYKVTARAFPDWALAVAEMDNLPDDMRRLCQSLWGLSPILPAGDALRQRLDRLISAFLRISGAVAGA